MPLTLATLTISHPVKPGSIVRTSPVTMPVPATTVREVAAALCAPFSVVFSAGAVGYQTVWAHFTQKLKPWMSCVDDLKIPNWQPST